MMVVKSLGFKYLICLSSTWEPQNLHKRSPGAAELQAVLEIR